MRLGKKAAAADPARLRDLDETRRVAYMLIASQYTGHIEAVGTVVNALAHHSKLADPDEAMRHAITVAEGSDGYEASGDYEDSLAWLKDRISHVTGLLGD